MKYIITFFITILFLSSVVFSQESSGISNNTDEQILERFQKLLDKINIFNNAGEIDNSFFPMEQKNQISEFFHNLQNNPFNSNIANNLPMGNFLGKTQIGKRFVNTEQINKTWDGTTWANSSKYSYSYDTRDNQVQYTNQTWNGTAWVNNGRASYLFDANDNRTEYIYQVWSGTWGNSFKTIYTYDGNSNLIEQLSQTWTGAWTNNSRTVSTFNADNNITQNTYQNWNGSGWDNSSKDTNTYDTNRNNILSETKNWSGGAWTNSSKSDRTFNANNKLTELINSTWNGTAWVNSSRNSYTYDANNNITEYLYQTWDVSTWKNANKTNVSYNAHNDITEYIYQSWSGTVWINVYKYLWSYDSRFNLTEALFKTWDVSVWKDYLKQNITYDTDDNLTESVTQSWNGSVWNNTYQYLYTYTAGHYSTSINLIQNYNFGDPTQTTSYQIIGLPGDNTIPVSDIVSGTPGADGDWRAFWDAGTGAFTEYNGSDIFKFTPGKAFWILSKNPININQNVNTVKVKNGTYSIPLHNEWNLISNPLDKNISWNSIQNLNSITQPIHFYQNGSYSNPVSFEMYKGYYFFNATHLPVLIIPYQGSAFLPKQNSINENELQIAVYSNTEQKAFIGIGISNEAKVGVDLLDIFAPPSQFSDVSINLINNNLETNYKLLQKDYRPEIGEGQEFDFIVKNTSANDVDMIISGTNYFGNNKVFLLDKGMWKLYDLNQINSFEVRKNTEKKEFSILIGTEEFILQKKADIMPTEFSLYQNYPNPFNPNTKIRFSVPIDEKRKTQEVNLVVYDILGNEVATLINEQKEPGFYEVEFNASKFSSGVYIYRLQSGSYIASKKMIVLK